MDDSELCHEPGHHESIEVLCIQGSPLFELYVQCPVSSAVWRVAMRSVMPGIISAAPPRLVSSRPFYDD